MVKKSVITVVVFALVGACVFAASAAIDSSVSLPQPITADSACPVVGCASGVCHGFDNVPQPDGIHEMTCPETTCSSTECHAWGTLATRYHRASDASLNLWVLAPVVLIVGLVALVRKLSENADQVR